MTSQGGKIFLLLNIFSVIRASHLETVHFTNSANKILKANNYTTYKVDVPNGEPITIIEANVPLIDKKIKFDDVEPAQYPKRHNQYLADDSANRKYNKPVMDLETSLSMTVTPNNYNDEYENSAASAIGEEESVKNDYSNLSPEQVHNHNRNTMKTVYSPELLQKFLKDYANKVQMAASSTASTENGNENFQVDKDKYVESQEQTNVNDDDDGNRRVSNVENEDKSEEQEDVQLRKNYRPGNHPYNKNSGWVTLDAVPWSKSKVSRWSSNQKHQNNYNNRPYRPPSASDYDYSGSNNDNDDYYAPKPSRPTYQNNQFYHNRPQSQESHAWHTSQQFHSSSNNYDHDQRPNRPEIITDNRPSHFPSHNEDHYHHQQQNQQQPQHNYAFSKPYNRPSSYGNNNNNDYSYSNHGNHFNSYKDGPHPQSYPQNGESRF